MTYRLTTSDEGKRSEVEYETPEELRKALTDLGLTRWDIRRAANFLSDPDDWCLSGIHQYWSLIVQWEAVS